MPLEASRTPRRCCGLVWRRVAHVPLGFCAGVSWVFPSQDERSCSLLPRFPPTRGARRARMQPCISFAQFSRPSVGRPGGGRDTVDLRAFCVCLGPEAMGPGFLGGELAPHGTQLGYRTPRASTQAARVIGQDSFSFHPSFSFSLFLFNPFQSFCVTNKYKREHTYIPVLNTSYQKMNK